MVRARKSVFTPNYAEPPGEILKEAIQSMGMSRVELAQRIGRPKKTIDQILQGRGTVTRDMAIQLERVLGVPASRNNLEKNYR